MSSHSSSHPSEEGELHIFEVPLEHDRIRLDRYLALQEILSCSRSLLKRFITEGLVKVQGKVVKPSQRLRAGDEVQILLPPPKEMSLTPEAIPLDILYEDSHLVVVNKASGMVVHPSPGHYEGTLVHALLHHCQDLSGIGGELRPGIVHRLDRYTSGSLVVAKDDATHKGLADLFKHRPKGKIERRYLAVAQGSFKEDRGVIDTLYGRHPTKRERFSSLVKESPRRAVTHFEVVERYDLATLVSLKLDTGRTHQIRVHLADRNRALIGDQMYGGKALPRWPNFLKDFPRQALHARSLSFEHPITGEWISCLAPLPQDFQELLTALGSNLSCEKIDL